jgi:hypothetical protein
MTNPLGIGTNPQPTLHVLQGNLKDQSFSLKTPEMKLGREGGDLDLTQYVQMSRLHARIFVENGMWNVQDLGSTNGTHINGERVVSRRLQDGDVLQLGNFSARISLPGQAQNTSRSSRTQVAPPQLTQSAPPIPSPTTAPTQHLPPQLPIGNTPWPSQATPQVPPQAYSPPPQTPPGAYSSSNYQFNNYSSAPPSSSGLTATAQTISTVALCLMCVGLIPCLGWLNWAAIPLGTISAVISLISLITEPHSTTRNSAVTGLIMGLLAAVIGTFRLILGAGMC